MHSLKGYVLENGCPSFRKSTEQKGLKKLFCLKYYFFTA